MENVYEYDGSFVAVEMEAKHPIKMTMYWISLGVLFAFLFGGGSMLYNLLPKNYADIAKTADKGEQL